MFGQMHEIYVKSFCFDTEKLLCYYKMIFNIKKTAQGYFYGIVGGILNGLRPHYDDKWLEKYLSLLVITDAFIKENAIKNS